METKAAQFWDKQASRYDTADEQFESVYRDIFARTRKYLAADDRLLDFGCATGSKTLELARSVQHVHVLDLSPRMIREALKKSGERQAANVTFSSGTIHSEALKEASYDKVIAYSVIHLLDDSEAAIQRIHQLLRPGGLFLSVTPCLRDRMTWAKRLQFSLVFLMQRLGLFPLHLNKWRMKDLEELVEKQGFQVVASELIFHDMTICFLVARRQVK
jgi:ubiquinone/menaquinone biosynthesis C-methylase UbiE